MRECISNGDCNMTFLRNVAIDGPARKPKTMDLGSASKTNQVKLEDKVLVLHHAFT